MVADAKTMGTSRPGVFAAGDVVSGPNTIIDAIAGGEAIWNAYTQVYDLVDGSLVEDSNSTGIDVFTQAADDAVQVYGGMGLMNDFPIERFWRDARVERIWDGTSEIQRHIISRELLRPLGA